MVQNAPSFLIIVSKKTEALPGFRFSFSTCVNQDDCADHCAEYYADYRRDYCAALIAACAAASLAIGTRNGEQDT